MWTAHFSSLISHLEENISMLPRDQLNASCEGSLDFPRNLIRHNSYEHTINSYHERLDEEESRLFQKEFKSAVDFSEFDIHGKGTSASRSSNGNEVCERFSRFAAQRSGLPAFTILAN